MVRMRTESILSFLSDEQGGGTIMGLFWFVLMVGICGMAVDSTDGFRNRTMLQATADSSALASVIDLPDGAAAIATAVSYSSDNMATSGFGHVLRPGDVTVGTWDHATRDFIPGGVAPDSVLVRLRQTAANDNAVPVNFLRIIGLASWDINVLAVAQRYVPDCLRDGLIASEQIDISSNNNFTNNICIHGQGGVEMQNHNDFAPGVNVSMPDMGSMLDIPSGGMTSNPGLPDALREQSFKSRLVPHVDEYMADLLTKQAYVTPAYIDTTQPVIAVDDKFNFTGMTQGRIYHVQCNPNKNANIPNNTVLMNVVIISDCNVSVGSGVTMINVVLGSRAVGNGSKPLDNANINFSADVRLGAPDGCAPGGGVQIFSSASVHFSSSMTINGVQIVAKGDIELGARDQGVNGINAHAGQDIKLTSNNAFGLCSGGSPQFFPVWYYRLVA